MRALRIMLQRWIGLATAIFLFIAGATGVMIRARERRARLTHAFIIRSDTNHSAEAVT